MGELPELVSSDLQNSTAGLEDGDAVSQFCSISMPVVCLQCFDAVGLAAGRASSL